MFTVDGDPQYRIVNLIDTCPCDLNEGICDKSDKICCCDKDCLSDMLNPTFYEKNKECDPSSYISRRINSKLDYCDDYTKSLDDLYNPLILAFKILKKGFCLYADHFKKNDDKTEYENNKNAILNNNGEKEKEDFTNVFPVNGHDLTIGEKAFEIMKFNAPIALPSGLCLFNSYPIKKYEDYEVICSYKPTQYNTDYLNKFTPTYKYLMNEAKNSYEKTNESANNENLFKKIEIIYYDNVDVPIIIKHYYEKYVTFNTDNYQDLTFVVKFLKDENDYKKSGNPGYIKGKPLLILEKNGDNYYKYNNDKVFPIDYNEDKAINEDKTTNDIYYNDYFDNKITFEDLIIYGYQNNYCKNYIKNMFYNHEYYVGQLGNANAHLINDWKKIEGFSNQYNPYLLMGLYQTIGTVNNAQIKIKEYAPYFISKDLVDGTYTYFISKFFKLKKIKTKWWYALPPGFFKLPRNTMYPFKVGTTNYQDGN